MNNFLTIRLQYFSILQHKENLMACNCDVFEVGYFDCGTMEIMQYAICFVLYLDLFVFFK